MSQEIIDRIKDRAIEPQVEVAVVTQNSSLITVLGEVNNEQRPARRAAFRRIQRASGCST